MSTWCPSIVLFTTSFMAQKLGFRGAFATSAAIALLLVLAMIIPTKTTRRLPSKENPTFLIQKDSPKKVLKDSLRTFQKEKIFALLLLTGLLKAPNSPLFPPGEYAKRCYIEPQQQQPQLATLEAYGSLTQKPRP